MLCKKKYCFWLFIVTCCWSSLPAQTSVDPTAKADTAVVIADSLFTINDVIITGNKKTKNKVILRELGFKEGDVFSISSLVRKFEDAREQLMNTTLFHSVIVAVKNFEGNKVDVGIDVTERWYLFPLPYFKPVDRNLNQWLVEQKANLSRVNYGGKLLYNNVSGRNDKLNIYLISGYTRQISLSYRRPYIDPRMKWGIRTGLAAGKNHEVNYNTIGNKQVFLKVRDNFVRKFANGLLEFTYRKAIKTRHNFGLSYVYEELEDSVIKLNPSYFKPGKKSTSFPEIYYNLTYFDLDYIPYPTKGYAYDIFLGKRGFNKNSNLWSFSAKALGSWPISPKSFFNVNVYGSIKLPFKQPYFNQRFLGYGDVSLQGYEYYVIDGVAGGYVKATFARELVNFKIRIPPVKKGNEAIYIPFRIFGKVYGNSGYVHNPQPGENLLSNKMLYSGGLGIDIISFYDVTFKLEWSFNQLGQNDIFLHRKSIF